MELPDLSPNLFWIWGFRRSKPRPMKRSVGRRPSVFFVFFPVTRNGDESHIHLRISVVKWWKVILHRSSWNTKISASFSETGPPCELDRLVGRDRLNGRNVWRNTRPTRRSLKLKQKRHSCLRFLTTVWGCPLWQCVKRLGRRWWKRLERRGPSRLSIGLRWPYGIWDAMQSVQQDMGNRYTDTYMMYAKLWYMMD